MPKLLLSSEIDFDQPLTHSLNSFDLSNRHLNGLFMSKNHSGILTSRICEKFVFMRQLRAANSR